MIIIFPILIVISHVYNSQDHNLIIAKVSINTKQYTQACSSSHIVCAVDMNNITQLIVIITHKHPGIMVAAKQNNFTILKIKFFLKNYKLLMNSVGVMHYK